MRNTMKCYQQVLNSELISYIYLALVVLVLFKIDKLTTLQTFF